MPLTDPNKSFEVSVRHLFKHLGDAATLRCNPLVRSLFEGPALPKSDRLRCAELRERILEAARECLTEDVVAGRRKQGERANKILVALCKGVKPKAAASELDLSTRQYYRDRAAITRRVARKLANACASSRKQSWASDALHLLVARAASLVDEGCAGTSIGLLERALPGISEPAGKALALLEMSNAYVQYGDVRRATECIEEAKCIQKRDSDSSSSADLLDRLLLASVGVALANGSDWSVPQLLDSIITRNQHKHSAAHPPSELILLDALLEKCAFNAVNGHFNDGRRVLAEASALAARMSVVPSQLGVWLTLMAAACSEDGSATPDQTLVLYSDALRVSLSAASARGAFYAINGQARAFLRIGEERRAHERFREALVVARSMEGTKFLVSAAIACTSLIHTAFWREALPLVQEAQAFVQADSLKAAQLRGTEGMLLSRMGKAFEALEALAAATELLTRLRNGRYHSGLLRERAVVLHRMGRAQDARASINTAVELANEHADALSLRQTYHVAAKILEDDRFLSQVKGESPN